MSIAARRPRHPTFAPARASIAGFDVRVSGAPARLRRLLLALWGKRATVPRGRLSYTLERRATGPVLSTPDGTIDLPSLSNPVLLHQHLLEDVFSRIGDAYALHAACVGLNGMGVLISGPSGFGKTTLAIHLALRGFQFLADDLVLVDRRTGRLEPVRRGIHLRTGSRRLLNADARKRARRAARLLGRDEWTIDPDRWLGPAGPCREVGLVVLLRPEADLHRVRRLEVVELAFADARRGLPSALTSVTGLRTRRRSPDGRRWRIEAEDPSALGAWIDSGPEGLEGWAKVTGTPPRFDGEPRAASVGRFQAAIELAQEVVNRAPRSRLGARYAGREAELPVDLASRIGKARCYGLVPGRLEDTVRLVEQLCEAISRRPPDLAGPR